jgi:hypothetical protein
MPRHSTAAVKELPEDLPQELWAAERVWVHRSGHLLPLSPLYNGSGSRWAKGRTTSPPFTSSPVLAASPSPGRCHTGATGPSRTHPPCHPSASASTSNPHRHRQLTLEPLFLACLPGFLHAQGKHLQAACNQGWH